MVRNNFMMHFCIVATLCFFEKNTSRNYYSCDQDENSLGLCFKSMYLTLIVAIFTSNFIFSMFKSSHTYRNINISNQKSVEGLLVKVFLIWSQMAGSEKKTPLMIIAPRTSPPVRPRILPRLIFEESRFTSNIPKHLNLPPAMRLMPSNFR